MTNNLHVLLVENNQAYTRIIRDLLATDGQARFEIECVPRLLDAIELVRKKKFDIVLLDLELPGSEGLEAFHAIRHETDIPIVVLTGNDDEKIGLAAIEEGAQDHVMKSHISGQTSGLLLVRVLCYALGRHLAAEHLFKAKEEWERTFDAVSDLIALIDIDRRIIRVNQAMAKRLGTTPDRMVGLRCSEAVHGVSEPPDFCPYSKLLAGEKEEHAEMMEERMGGCFDVCTTALRDNAGQLIGCVHVAHDITARKKADSERETLESQLRQAQKMEAEERLSATLRKVLCAPPKEINLPLLSILAVDDEKEILQMLEIFLADSGFHVETAISASEALKKINSKHFDLVISDINMPDMSGLELLRAVKSKGNKTDFILITGLPDFKAAVTAIKEGAYDYLSKPLNLDDLQNKISHFMLDRENGHQVKTKCGNVRKIKNGYSIVKSIGTGGAGTVLLVEKNESYFAMKILNNSGSEIDKLTKKRFKKEAEILKSLDNAHVVKLFDVGGFEGDDTPFIVMEYIHGAPLSKYIKNVNLTDEDKLSVTLQIASALDYIHSKSILHRDLKPENVLLTEDLRVKITDFGISKIIDPSLTLTDALRGSPCYMAPEILKGETQGDSKSDIFSFGVLVYELFTGERPFSDKTAHAVMEKIKTSKPSAPRSINPEIPEWLQDAMARMLDKNPVNRFASVSELTKIMTHYMANPDDFKSGQSLTRKIFRSILFRENVWK